jgi:hypothetical protein
LHRFGLFPYTPYARHIAEAVPSAKQAFLSAFWPTIASQCGSHAYFLSGAANFLSIPAAWMAKKMRQFLPLGILIMSWIA